MGKSAAVVVIGAGVGGLTAAIDLAARGLRVVVVEQASGPGGKLQAVQVGGQLLDSGPTVFTLRGVFDELFDLAGSSLASELTLRPAAILARHVWEGGATLDLHADPRRNEEAIGAFAGARAARDFVAFSAQAQRSFLALEHSYLRAQRPSLPGLVRAVVARHPADLLQIQPFGSLWNTLGRYFREPRLRQLFARYSTYCGSSPFSAPATLMLIAQVEAQGVWLIEGGMHQLATALARLAAQLGVELRYSSPAERILVTNRRVASVRLANGEELRSDAVVFNGDASALAAGLLGASVQRAAPANLAQRRSLSAVTWNLVAGTSGLALSHHNVFFSNDYRAEFDAIARGRLPVAPTVYVCAQDREADERERALQSERLLCLVNAPAMSDDPHTAHRLEPLEIQSCEQNAFGFLSRCGLTVARTPTHGVMTTPADFAKRYPGTGGALYGTATHGWRASFTRPGSRTLIPGLYLAGGSSHPGAGVPMAALSGRCAAASVFQDLTSARQWSTGVTPGGISMR